MFVRQIPRASATRVTKVGNARTAQYIMKVFEGDGARG